MTAARAGAVSTFTGTRRRVLEWEEPEGRVARLRRRLAAYEPPPAEQDPQDRESSEPMEMEEEGEGSVPTGRSAT
ncbi:hypothetical protein U9M48_003372 [Paspalum notatum var. saurae]|uniref:Uncharacterized protein n=1 Tax=Paspalum notatum var. saurae TaxID=547442 RepID=A0AAQ3SE00_PASNO